MTPKGLQSLYDTKGVTKSVRHQRGYKVCMTPKGLQSLYDTKGVTKSV